MLHQGPRSVGGDVPNDVESKICGLLDQFVGIVAKKVEVAKIRRAVVRSMLPCSTVHVIDSRALFVAAQKQNGMPSTVGLDYRDKQLSPQEVFAAAIREFGFDAPFVLQFPAALLDQDADSRTPALTAIADGYI